MNRDDGTTHVLRKVKDRAITSYTMAIAISGDYLGKWKAIVCFFIRDV